MNKQILAVVAILVCSLQICLAELLTAVPGKSIGKYSLEEIYDPHKVFKDSHGTIMILADSDAKVFMISSINPNLRVANSNIKIGDTLNSVFDFYGKTSLSKGTQQKFGMELYQYRAGIAFQIEKGRVSTIAVMPRNTAEQDAAANP